MAVKNKSYGRVLAVLYYIGIVLAVRAKNTGDCSGVRRAGFILSQLGAIFGGPVFFAFYYMLTAAQLF